MEKEKILELIKKAESLTPKNIEEDLKPMDGVPVVPSWHKYESDIWEIGEEIRQIITTKKSLRKDNEINELIINFCQNRNSKRGRQSFILLLGYKDLSGYASKLINMVNDKFVYGQIIDTIYKMRAGGYDKEIRPFLNDKNTWIKNLAKKYIEKHGTQQGVKMH